MSALPELTRKSSSARESAPPPPERGIFVVVAGGERLALPVECVHTIFRVSRITPVPGGPAEVAGLANLRGKIVTVVSLRVRLGMPRAAVSGPALAIGIEHHGESIALLVDDVGDVISVSEAERVAAPPHLAAARLRLVVELGDKIERLPTPERHPGLGLPLLHLDPHGASAAQRVALALECVLGHADLHEGALA